MSAGLQDNSPAAIDACAAGFLDQIQPRSFVPGTDVDADPFNTVAVEDAGRYLGWDVLSPPRDWSNVARNSWFHFRLDRPAMAGIAWWSDTAKPSWLASWNRLGQVVIEGRSYPVYRKRLARGGHSLGGPDTGADCVRNYLVLLGEENGRQGDRSRQRPNGQGLMYRRRGRPVLLRAVTARIVGSSRERLTRRESAGQSGRQRLSR